MGLLTACDAVSPDIFSTNFENDLLLVWKQIEATVTQNDRARYPERDELDDAHHHLWTEITYQCGFSPLIALYKKRSPSRYARRSIKL